MHRSWLEVSSTFIPVEVEGHKVWYDEPNQLLILMKKNVYFTIALQRLEQPPMNFVHVGVTLDVKFSPCKKFLAIQRSDVSIDIVDLVGSTETKVSCKTKRGNLILKGGVLWLDMPSQRVENERGSQLSLCIVTRFGLEIYKLPCFEKGEANCKLAGKVKCSIQSFWSLLEHNVLLLQHPSASGDGIEMRPFQFQSSNIPTKLGKFTPTNVPGQRDVYLAKLYDSIYCVQIICATRTIHVYKLGRESTPLFKTLQLFATRNIGFSIVDHLICVHNMEGGFTSIYDVNADTDQPCMTPKPMYRSLNVDERFCSSKFTLVEGPTPFKLAQSGNVMFPVVLAEENETLPRGSMLVKIGPMSVENISYPRIIDMLEAAIRPIDLYFYSPQTDDLRNDISEQIQENSNYSAVWVFLYPNWLLDAKSGSIRQLELNLDHIPSYGDEISVEISEPSFLLRDPKRLFAFLLRRGCAPPQTSIVDFVHGESPRDERAYSKAVFLHHLRSLLLSKTKVEVGMMVHAFELMNQFYLKALREKAAANSNSQIVPLASNSNSFTAGLNASGALRSFGKPSFLFGAYSKRNNAKTKSPQSQHNKQLESPRFVGLTFDDEETISYLDSVFLEFKETGRIALKDIRCYNGNSVILQIDIFTWMMIPSIPADLAAGKAICERLSVCLSEYIRSLQQYSIPVEKYMHELMCALLISAQNFHVLYQLLQYRVPTDSERLAKILLEASGSFSPFLQISLDMFHRLGLHAYCVDALLMKDELLLALKTLQKHPHCLCKVSSPINDAGITSRSLFECALRIGSRDRACISFSVLHSFFMAVDPQVITVVSTDEEPKSSLAKDCKDVEIPPEISEIKEWPAIRRVFGFP